MIMIKRWIRFHKAYVRFYGVCDPDSGVNLSEECHGTRALMTFHSSHGNKQEAEGKGCHNQ